MLTKSVYLSVYFELKRSYLRAAFGKKLEPKFTSISKVKAKIYSNLLLFELKVLLNLFTEQTRWVLIVTKVFTTKVSFQIIICAIQHNVVYKPVFFKFGWVIILIRKVILITKGIQKYVSQTWRESFILPQINNFIYWTCRYLFNCTLWKV